MFRKTPVAIRKVTVARPTGLHARPCLSIVKTVQQFSSEVEVAFGEKRANAHEILDLLCLGAGQGTELTLTAKGPDAEAVLDALADLFARNFDLDE